MPVNFCVSCGAARSVGGKFCGSCGAPLVSSPSGERVFAGFVRRYAAAAIDLVIISGVWASVFLAVM
jgi:hypothetical protein